MEWYCQAVHKKYSSTYLGARGSRVEKQIVETIGFRHLVNSSPKQSALELLQVQYHAIFTVAESTPFVYELGIVAVLVIYLQSCKDDAILTRLKVQSSKVNLSSRGISLVLSRSSVIVSLSKYGFLL